MRPNRLLVGALLVFTCSTTGLLAGRVKLPPVVANENRAWAGELRDGVLKVRLEIAEGEWLPGSETGERIPIYAFGEVGRPLQNPGPLLRVPQGTAIHATIHNQLPVTVTVHGLYERSTKENLVTIAPGVTQEVSFKAAVAGTYLYWAATAGHSLLEREPIESQLHGSLIIDPPGVVANDRVFVIGLWDDDPGGQLVFHGVATINGKSWPYTERFSFRVGQTVRWRVLNPTFDNHAMHLHGFYYRIEAIGDNERMQTFSPPERPMVVTQRVKPGHTFEMSWIPERPGRWIFHCHMLYHMTPPTPRPSPALVAAHAHAGNAEPDAAGMGGLVLGITVEPTEKPAKAVAATSNATRRLQLLIEQRKTGRPLFALAVRDAAKAGSKPAAESDIAPQLIGPPIVLSRGQPTEVEVVNHLQEPTGIHWHGIELESYYDGVPGWGGSGPQTTPAIRPGASFVARMTPPRAGTFIYHTHWHNAQQLTNGIYGPLIVLPSGEDLNAAVDKTFLFSLGIFEPFGPMLLINGSPQPAPLRLMTGTKYHFRLINIAPNNVAMQAALQQAGQPVQWRMIAKDGADLLPQQARMETADLDITVGETYDFEYTSSSAVELALEIYLPGPKLRATQALVFAPRRSGE